MAMLRGGERTIFREVEGAAEVARALLELFPDRFPGCAKDLDMEGEDLVQQLLLSSQMKVFAEFETVRSKMKLGRCAIDLDVASFGMSLIEIEVMCEDTSQVADAEAEIENVARLLQAQPLSKGTGGKLETYIRRYCPEVLANLIDVGVLAANVNAE